MSKHSLVFLSVLLLFGFCHSPKADARISKTAWRVIGVSAAAVALGAGGYALGRWHERKIQGRR
ncbi:MAG: hypothetical protein SFT81_00670 [Candidatus Caenarcaniphilales bacterium]|nr:hypothetical protein [Candidatus Caenarcaniphilales bacterium]